MGKNRNKRSKLAQKNQEDRQARHVERMSNRKKKKQRKKQDEMKYLDDMKRFREELIQYGLTIIEVGGDGNCLFRSISDQLDGTQMNHKQYRKDAIDYMLQNRDNFEPFIEDDVPFDEYIDDMDKDGEWGGNLEIQALSMRHEFNAIVHQLDAPVFAVSNFDPNAVRTIHLSYHLGEHYNSVRLLEDGNFNEPPMLIPLNLEKDEARLDQYHEENDQKMKNNAKNFKSKTKVKHESKQAKDTQKEVFDLKNNPEIVQYACTITELSDFHVMKQTLDIIFEGTKYIDFEKIEAHRKQIEQQ